MVWQIEVASKPDIKDARGEGVLADIHALGISGVESVRSARLFLIDTAAPKADVERVARELLADPVVETFAITKSGKSPAPPPEGSAVVVVSRKPGVMDPVAGSTQVAVADMGIAVRAVATARKYYLSGALGGEDLATVATKILANDCVEDVAFEDAGPQQFKAAPPYEFKLVHVPLSAVDDERLQRISRDGGLFLNIREMQTIQAYYKHLGREPTDVEL